MYFVGVVE